MSLTSLLAVAQIRQKFKETFPKPNVKLDGPILAAPQTKNYPLVGTAFDYLVRFYIESQNPNAVSACWIAESGLKDLRLHSGKYIASYDSDKKTVTLVLDDQYKKDSTNPAQKELEIAEKNFKHAQENYRTFLESGKMTKSLIKSAIHLAQLDSVFRSGHVDFSDVRDEDVTDLDNLINVFGNKELFSSDSVIYLNPTFGEGSHVVGGADADLIIDDTLIDIKTTKILKFDQKMYHQIVGYYLLSRIGKVNDMTRTRIKNIGIYFSRHGILYTLPVDTIEKQTDIPEFLSWFTKAACEIRDKHKQR